MAPFNRFNTLHVVFSLVSFSKEFGTNRRTISSFNIILPLNIKLNFYQLLSTFQLLAGNPKQHDIPHDRCSCFNSNCKIFFIWLLSKNLSSKIFGLLLFSKILIPFPILVRIVQVAKTFLLMKKFYLYVPNKAFKILKLY